MTCEFSPISVGKTYFDGFGSKTLSYGAFYPVLLLSKAYESAIFFTSDIRGETVLMPTCSFWPKDGADFVKKKEFQG